jgi:TRAP-type mannitol/chloroaromatic compound transport system substrate-binding protein
LELMMNRENWDALSDTQRAQIEVVCGDNFREGLAEGEAIQGKALATLKEKGVIIHRWPPEILDTLSGAWDEVVSELAAEDANFKRTWESLQAFRAEYAIWKELGYLN